MTELTSRTTGKKACERCGGKGMYNFQGTYIFCESCHGEAGVTTLWKTIEGKLASIERLPSKHTRKSVWRSNARILGFEAAETSDKAKKTWNKLGAIAFGTRK